MSTITAIEIDTTDLAREIAEAEFAERDVFPSLWSLLDGLREARKRGRNARATVLNDRAVAEFVRLKIEDAVIDNDKIARLVVKDGKAWIVFRAAAWAMGCSVNTIDAETA